MGVIEQPEQPDAIVVLAERWKHARSVKERRHLRRTILREIARRQYGSWHRRQRWSA